MLHVYKLFIDLHVRCSSIGLFTWRSVVDGCVLICLLCRVFFKVRANRRVGKSKDPKNRVPEIAVPDLVGWTSFAPPVLNIRSSSSLATELARDCARNARRRS